MAMTLSCCFFMFFLFGSTSAFTIPNVTLPNDYSITAEDLISKLTKSFVEYDKTLDDYINWVEFDKMFEEMNKQHGEFSTWNIGDVRKFFLQSRDYYFDAVAAVTGWCEQIEKLLKPYIEILHILSRKANEDRRDMIVNILDASIQKMSDALENLDKSRDNLNTGVVELTNVMTNITETFKRDQQEHENYLYELNDYVRHAMAKNFIAGIVSLIMVEAKYKPNVKEHLAEIESSFNLMKSKLTESMDKALTVKNKLLAEIQSVAELQAAAQSNKVLSRFSFYPTVKRVANALITECAAYQTKHGLKA